MKIGNGRKSKFSTYKLSLFLLLVILVLFNSCSSGKLDVYTYTGTTMGTTYSIKIVEDLSSSKFDDLDKKIDSILVHVNQRMSTYISDSELSNFNNSKDTNWVNVSEELSLIIFQSIEVGNLSKGSFDITIGPLVNLWGFGPNNKNESIPTEKEITELKQNIGLNKIKVDFENSKIKKLHPGIYLDLSGIAKGYGVDKVGLFLESLGIKNYMVEIGGEVRTKGLNGKKAKWKIGISTPTNDGLQKIVAISNYSMATSGDYLNYFEENGVRYSHTIDPVTGKPITHNLASVTVIHKDCAYADAFATAIDVMGPTVGYNFALNQKLPVFMIVREENGFVEKMTPQFKDFINKEK